MGNHWAGWKGKWVSRAGRVVLIKSYAIQSTTLMPKRAISMARDTLSDGLENAEGLGIRKWAGDVLNKKMTFSKDSGHAFSEIQQVVGIYIHGCMYFPLLLLFINSPSVTKTTPIIVLLFRSLIYLLISSICKIMSIDFAVALINKLCICNVNSLIYKSINCVLQII